jgi:hypothetical protein
MQANVSDGHDVLDVCKDSASSQHTGTPMRHCFASRSDAQCHRYVNVASVSLLDELKRFVG